MKKNVYIPPKIDPIPLSPEKHAELEREVVRLTMERDAASERVKVAREMGDLSENGAYHYGKQELASYSRQLREVHFLLKYGVVTVSSQSDVVEFGSTVTVSDGKKEREFSIVSQYESDPYTGKLSVESPIGLALLGKRVGDVVTIAVPAGEIKYTVLKIS